MLPATAAIDEPESGHNQPFRGLSRLLFAGRYAYIRGSNP